MEIKDLNPKLSTEEILKRFRNLKDNESLRVFTKNGFIIKSGGMIHKMQNGVLYAGTKNNWVKLFDDN